MIDMLFYGLMVGCILGAGITSYSIGVRAGASKMFDMLVNNSKLKDGKLVVELDSALMLKHTE